MRFGRLATKHKLFEWAPLGHDNLARPALDRLDWGGFSLNFLGTRTSSGENIKKSNWGLVGFGLMLPHPKIFLHAKL